MGQVDDFQLGEEAVAQMREEEALKDRERLAEEFAAEPLMSSSQREHRLELVPVDKIRTGTNVREELRDIEGLARQIRQVGQIVPIKVRPTDTGDEYLLIAGHRRLAAMQLIAEVTGEPVLARAEVMTEASEEDHVVHQLFENDRDPLEPSEWARGIRFIMAKHPDWDAGTIAKRVGKKREFVQKHLRLLTDLPPEVRSMVESGDLSFNIADILRRGAKKGTITEEEAVELAESVAAGDMSAGEAKEKAQPRMHEAPENYQELSDQLDRQRWEKDKPSKEEQDLEGEADDWLSGATPWESDSNGSSDAELVYSSTDEPAARAQVDPTRSRAEWSEQLEEEHLDAYLLGLLLSKYVTDAYLKQQGTSRAKAYDYAVKLDEGERWELLRELARTLVANEPTPPKPVLKAAGVKL